MAEARPRLAGAPQRSAPTEGGGSWGNHGPHRTAASAPRRARDSAHAARRRARCGSGSGCIGSTAARPWPSAAVGTSGCMPAPAAASIAAPRAVVSTSSGRVTGRPVTSARIWRSRSPRAPPATHTSSVGASPAARIAWSTSRSAKALPSSSARAMWARPCAAVSPNQPARGVGVPLGRQGPGQRGHPQHAVGAGRDAPGQAVQELVDVGAGGRRAGGLDRPQLVAEPAVRAAREPARVLEQPAAGVGVRVHLGDRRRDRARAPARPRTPARPSPSRRTRPRARTRPPRASPPSRRRSRARPGWSRARGVAQPRRDGAEHRVRPLHRRQRAGIDAERRAGLWRPVARLRSSSIAEEAFDGSTATSPEARQATNEPGSRNQRAAACWSARWAQARRSWRPRGRDRGCSPSGRAGERGPGGRRRRCTRLRPAGARPPGARARRPRPSAPATPRS